MSGRCKRNVRCKLVSVCSYVQSDYPLLNIKKHASREWFFSLSRAENKAKQKKNVYLKMTGGELDKLYGTFI